MRVMIVGQRWLAAEVLALCLRRGDQVLAVAAPGSGDRLALAAAAVGIPVLEHGRHLGAEAVPAGVDVILCAHAHCFITAGARQRARLGAVGYHPSLLPRHRGRDAIRWAIHMREDVTGGTVYWMGDRADDGPIAAQEWCWVRPEDTPDTLWRRELGPLGVTLFERVLRDLDAGVVVATPQDEALASWEPAWHSGRLATAGG